MRELFNRQSLAIATLKSSNSPYDPTILIPYLGYATDLSAYFGPFKPMLEKFSKEDIAKTRAAWPAFDALLAAPNSSPALAAYCTDKANPRNLRITSFLVLRYVDRRKFDEISDALKEEFRDSEQPLKTYLDGVITGDARFMGVYNFGMH